MKLEKRRTIDRSIESWESFCCDRLYEGTGLSMGDVMWKSSVWTVYISYWGSVQENPTPPVPSYSARGSEDKQWVKTKTSRQFVFLWIWKGKTVFSEKRFEKVKGKPKERAQKERPTVPLAWPSKSIHNCKSMQKSVNMFMVMHIVRLSGHTAP